MPSLELLDMSLKYLLERGCIPKGRSLYYTRDRYKGSKYKGIHLNKHLGRWAAQVSCDDKKRHLGYFTDEIEVAHAYNQSARKYHGQFTLLSLSPDE
jgi:hypothetical protein